MKVQIDTLSIKKTKNKIIVEYNSKVIGYLNYNYANDASGKRNIEISYMYIDPKFRRKSIGSKLLTWFISHFINKVAWITLWTGKNIEKTGGTSFYIRNGFVKLAYQENYYEKGIGTTLFAKKGKLK